MVDGVERCGPGSGGSSVAAGEGEEEGDVGGFFFGGEYVFNQAEPDDVPLFGGVGDSEQDV